MKEEVFRNEAFTLYLEPYQGSFFYHCDVRKWNKEVKKQYLNSLDKLVSLLPSPLYALIDQEDKKLIKFAKLSKMKQHQEIVGLDDKPYFIFVRGK